MKDETTPVYPPCPQSSCEGKTTEQGEPYLDTPEHRLYHENNARWKEKGLL